uniref:Uncharacterized protein n=1 Tax=Leersia perrieri TaxID=77586 RepID=A0A0D9VPE1_9ORYZ
MEDHELCRRFPLAAAADELHRRRGLVELRTRGCLPTERERAGRGGERRWLELCGHRRHPPQRRRAGRGMPAELRLKPPPPHRRQIQTRQRRPTRGRGWRRCSTRRGRRIGGVDDGGAAARLDFSTTTTMPHRSEGEAMRTTAGEGVTTTPAEWRGKRSDNGRRSGAPPAERRENRRSEASAVLL